MRNTWQVVVLVCAALASVDILALLHASALVTLMSVIGGTVVPTVSLMLLGHQISGQVADVHKEVNGRMSELIQQKTQPPEGGNGGS